MNRLMHGNVIATIFSDSYLVAMLTGIIVCGIALVGLLITIGISYI